MAQARRRFQESWGGEIGSGDEDLSARAGDEGVQDDPYSLPRPRPEATPEITEGVGLHLEDSEGRTGSVLAKEAEAGFLGGGPHEKALRGGRGGEIQESQDRPDYEIAYMEGVEARGHRLSLDDPKGLIGYCPLEGSQPLRRGGEQWVTEPKPQGLGSRGRVDGQPWREV